MQNDKNKKVAIEELTYLLSHDLRTPLRHARMYSEFLSEECSKAGHTQYWQYSEKICSATRTLEQQLDSLLEYSRIGKGGLKLEKVNLASVLHEILDDMKSNIEECSAEVIVESLPEVVVDEPMIKLLLQHLMDNAIKFKKKDTSLSIRISAEELVNAWMIRIQDNGIGINPKNFDKIFLFFQRLNPKVYPGIGIGLPICNKIAGLHEGKLLVASELGVGTTFSVLIPKIDNVKAIQQDISFSNAFRLALENSPIGKVLVNAEEKIIYVNKAIEQTFLYSDAELLGQELEIFMTQRFKEQYEVHQAEFMKYPESRTLGIGREFYAMRKDGTEIPVEVGFTSFSTSEGRFVMATIINVTAKKQLEEAIRSNKELEQFAYFASHDLQAPLRHISSYIEALMHKHQQVFDEQSQHWLSIITNGVTRMRSLINDLLRCSRVNTEKLVFTSIDFKNMLEVVLETLHDLIVSSKASVTIVQTANIDCIPNFLQEVFQNLIENAIKFQKPDLPPVIHISIKSDQDSWLISVKDNGIGIESKYLDKIFMPFQRLHKAKEKPGNGIGLAIVKKIIEMHHGKIWVESQLSEGSNFLFTIPKMKIKVGEDL